MFADMKLLQLPNIGNGGRLGNMLWTIASTIGLALRHGYTPRFPANWKYRDRFNIPDEWFGEIERGGINVKESCYEHDTRIEIMFGTASIINLAGYLQSHLYWQGFEDKIREYLTPKDCQPASINRVAIHYRRTDYVGNQNYKQLGLDYYLQQYSEYFYPMSITAFSDDADFVKLHHAGDWFHDDDPINELSHMAAHRYHITANSTFSWWGAYLSGGAAIAPDTWFDGPLLRTCSVKTLFPDGWLKMLDGKCYLMDVTFIIPVMYDHPDRAKNLDISKRFINTHFLTNIIVGEINTSQMQADVRFDYGGKFHRTKALNELTRMAKTPYVVNLDADVVVPPFQLLKMVCELRSGADIVYPYDGTFAGVERKHFTAVKDDLNLPALRGENWRGFGEARFKSVGGVVGYNKQSFLDAGGENENFISYSPEDQERFWRFNLLGLKVMRIDGPLFHLDHFRGPDSTMRNPDSVASHKYWDKIKHFNKQQLIEHLNLSM